MSQQLKCVIEKDGELRTVLADVLEVEPGSEAALFGATAIKLPWDLYGNGGFELCWVEGAPKWLFINDLIMPGFDNPINRSLYAPKEEQATG